MGFMANRAELFSRISEMKADQYKIPILMLTEHLKLTHYKSTIRQQNFFEKRNDLNIKKKSSEKKMENIKKDTKDTRQSEMV